MLVLTLLGALASTVMPALPVVAADRDTQIAVIPPGSAYRQRNLISDVPGMALVQDRYLVNPWGISMTAGGPFRVANNGTSTSTSYLRDVAGVPLAPRSERLTIPGGLPTGTVVYSGASGFALTGPSSAPARVIFASITGNIVAWNPNVPAPGSVTGQIAASHPGRVYTGLAIANNGAYHLYAADFANGNIDVYDTNFALTTLSGAFADPTIPTTAGNTYHPYNIQSFGGSIYVMYAKVGLDGRAEEGVGNGFVRRFNTDGVRDLTFGINNGPLNAPWGVVQAPATFGIFGSALLIGNFGRGNPSIHAFNPTTGAFLGTIQNEAGNGIVIDELWGLAFGNGGDGGSPGTLYFSAGVGQEEHGLFGSLVPTTSSATSTIQFSTDEYVIGEGSASIQITATRSGDASGAASVRYATWDRSQPGHASQKSDYALNVGVVSFAPGETSQRFTVQLINDRFVEGAETIDLVLSNPIGTGVGLGSPNAAELKITDNDTIAPTTNPIDGTAFFVRQHFVDFLRREPTASDLAYWSNIIDACGSNTTCRKTKRIAVSAQFLLLKEHVDSVGLIYRMHKAAFGADPLYGDIVLSTQLRRALGTTTMSNLFASNPRFVSRYQAASNTTYVNALATNSGFAFSTATKNSWIAGLNNASLTRASVLLKVAGTPGFAALVRNRWIVLSGYWEYLRRDPDTSTFNLRLSHLNAAGGDPIASGLIGGFLTGAEYRQRFGPS
jgi:uncharacterized protein (TIGR03118 family)